MIPDTATIIKRRHLVTTVVRLGLIVWGSYISYQAVEGVYDLITAAFVRQGTLGLTTILYVILPFVPWVAVLLLHPTLVRWIVPVGAKADLCPKCGYSLKNLSSPICPECGLTLRTPAPPTHVSEIRAG